MKTKQYRQHLTILITDLCDSTSLASDIEPEHYSHLLDQMRENFVCAAECHGGQIIRVDADGFIFIFGHPNQYEDGARRAVEAALDMHAYIETLDQGKDIRRKSLKLRTGIHSGIVLMKEGDLASGHYEILGNPTNVTSKICKLAAPGEIFVSDEALGPDHSNFRISKNTHLDIRGQKNKVLVKTVIGRRNEDPLSHLASNSADFVGRREDLTWLREFSSSTKTQTLSSDTAIALIVAEGGLGKSRLLHEFSQSLGQDRSKSHFGFCESYLGVKPFQPIIQIFAFHAGCESERSK